MPPRGLVDASQAIPHSFFLQSFGCGNFRGLLIAFISMYRKKKVQSALSRTLIAWRHEKNLSQEQLATLSGLSRQYLSRLEACKQLPRLDSLFRILVSLEKSFADLGTALDEILEDAEKRNPVKMAAEKGPFWSEK